jgi:2-oxoisovalerate dehydrogenase E2 component (dihydrolipoyl transacylase)
MNIFKLPDLGEGLTEVEIVEWLIAVGDEVKLDQPLVSVETAKAIVEIPSPQTGKIFKLYGGNSEIIQVGDPFIEFESDASSDQKASGKREDTGTVVGEVIVGKEVKNEQAITVGQASSGVKATPAVRALAKRLDVDLSVVTPSGPKETISAADVQRVAKIFEQVGPLEPLRGVRRSMANAMARANAEIVPVTIYDDVDIDPWKEGGDITMRLIRAITKACEVEPSLNSWYDSHAMGRRLLKKIDLGIAVDTADGLFVPVLRNVEKLEVAQLRQALDTIKTSVKNRDIPPENMRGYTFTLSNFGMFAGRYANPIVIPPTVAILGAGCIRKHVVVANDQAAVHWVLPLSLTFDHRAVTGGEATRFVAALLTDLAQKD